MMAGTERNLVFSVTIHDCRVDTFRSGGKGGQHQNTSDTGVRVVHEPSGAVGESREQRSQLQNKKAAFRRMADHAKFKLWVNKQLYAEPSDGNAGYAWKFEAGRWAPNTGPDIPADEIKIEYWHNSSWIETK